MAQTIKLKRSATAGAAPTTSQLELGEVAINTYDGKMYIKKSVGGTESIVEISGGGGASAADAIFEEYLYTATNNQTAFSGNDDNSSFLSYVSGAIQVFLNGVLLDPETDYTATNGATVTLTSGAATGDYLQIIAFKKKIGDSSITIDTFSGNNSTTAYTLSLDPGDENNTRVFIDGVYQSKSNYAVSGTTLTFSSAPPSGTGIEVEIGNRAVSLDTTSSLDLPDNVKLRLGTGQDLQIYSDGTNSYIEERNTTSGLRITSDNQVAIRKHDNENIALFNVDGAVRLYHDNSQKFETTSTGVDVTGNIVVSGTVDGRDVAADGATAVAALPRTGGAMTGAITTNSTFDGRNVATDGAKLDGIESGATADQTQSEINALGITATGLSGTPAISVANITTTGELRGPASFVVDPAAVGDNTGTVIIKGNLQVDGATTTINSTTLTVDDLNITLASGAANGTAANGAGITVDGASATITYNSTGDSWDFNKGITANSGISVDNITIDGNEIDVSSGNLTLDVAGDIVLDADGADVIFADDGTQYGFIGNSSSDMVIKPMVQDKDLIFKGNDSGSTITALTLDMSDAGSATFNNHISLGDNKQLKFGASNDVIFYHNTSNNNFQITNNNTAGGIVIQNNGSAGGIALQPVINENAVYCAPNGAVLLYHNGSSKLQTTSGGVQVTGNIGNTSGDLTLDVAGSIHLDADDSGHVRFKDGGTQYASIYKSGSDAIMDTTGNFTLDAAGDIILDAAGDDIIFKTGGVEFGSIFYTNSNLYLNSSVSNGDIVFRGNDDGSAINALVLDMSAAGSATFNNNVTVGNSLYVADKIFHTGDPDTFLDFNSNLIDIYAGNSLGMRVGSGGIIINESGGDYDFRVESDGLSHALFVDAGNNQVIVGSGTAVGAALFAQRFSSNNTYTTTNDTRYASGKQVIYNESNTTDTFSGITLLTGSSSGGTVELNAIRTSTALQSDFAIKTRNVDGNSSEKLRVKGHSGFVGIGTSSPENKLQIGSVGSTNYGGNDFVIGDGTRVFATYLNSTSDAIEFYTNKNYAFLASGGTGNVGIGNTDPNLPLTVTSNSGANAIAVRARSNDDYSFVQFYNNAGTALRGQIYNHNGNIGFTTGTDSSAGNDLYIKDGGNVGIGTTNPQNALSVQGVISSGNSAGVAIGGTPADANTAELGPGYLNLARDDTAAAKQILFGKNGSVHSYLETTTSGLNIGGANVGIGNTSPNAKLEVKGSGGGTGLTLKTTDAASNEVFYVQDGGRVGLNYWPLTVGIPSGTAAATNAKFQVEEAGLLTVLTNGNVGIGTTAPSLKFDLSSSTSFGLPGTSGTTPVGFARIGYNDRTWGGNEILVGIINAGANDYAGYIQSKVPTDYSQNRAFLINPQGGNVGIGTSSSTAPLHVSKDLDSGGNILQLTNADSTYSQHLTVKFNSSKDIEFEGASGNGGIIMDPGARGTRFQISSADIGRFDSDGLRLEAGKGIKFSPHASSNILDDYEEGTWTGRLSSSSSGGTYYDSAGATGYYIKIGRVVHIQIHYTQSASGSGGSIFLQGLPYAAQYYNSMTHWFFSGFSNLTAGYVPILRTQVSTNAIIFQAQKGGSSSIDIPASHFGGGMNIMVSGTYITAS